MVLKEIQLEGFRNLENNRLSFDENLNYIIGDNGAGKTNLLEAIFYAAFASSFRTREEQNLIKLNEKFLRVDAQSSGTSASVFYNGEKRLILGGNQKQRLNEYIGWLLITVLSLDDIWIARGSPARRRAFLDWLLTKLSPSYVANLGEYRRILRQRNRVLQSIREGGKTDLLEVYNEQLVLYGNEIYKERDRIIPELRDKFTGIGTDLGLVQLDIAYKSTCPGMRLCTDLLDKVRADEVRWGETVIGPHRDDLVITIAGFPLKNYASEGETRIAVICLKIAEAEILMNKTRERPVMLLDEACAELDPNKRKTLFELLKGQIFYASCQDTCFPDIPDSRQAKRFLIQWGRVEAA
jgi:DNA replication and repair protein RecF